jgi:hypothetical protein
MTVAKERGSESPWPRCEQWSQLGNQFAILVKLTLDSVTNLIFQ